MAEPVLRCLAVSDFNVDTLAGYLAHDDTAPRVDVTTAPFGHVEPTLLEGVQGAWRHHRPDALLIWTQPQGVSPAFRKLLEGERAGREELDADVDRFAELLTAAAPHAGVVLVPSWVVPAYQRGLGLLDLKHAQGLAQALLRMNLRLAERLAGAPSIYLLDTTRWAASVGERASSPKLWYLTKTPFGRELLQLAAAEVKAALRTVRGGGRKLLVLDLDDTLWGGVVGETGWEHVQLGGHDPVGEAFVDFQRALKALTRRGILLGLVSKNEEAVALEAIDRHPEMVLRRGDFAGWKINWQDKARNVAELAAELNLGLQSVVFVDNHPVERARVREALPEVLVPEWPEDPMLFVKALARLPWFDPASLSQEDAARTQLYATERERIQLKRDVGSLEAWLARLETRVVIEPLTRTNLPRAAQLLNKTNQMNLRTRRLAESELWAWAQGSARTCWTVRVSDRFGDAGLTGLVSLEAREGAAYLEDFVLSCRVMGRKIEETMLAAAVQHARAQQLHELIAEYLPTPKNEPCRAFWERSGCRRNGSCPVVFRWDAAERCPLPAQVDVVFRGAETPVEQHG